MYEIKKNAARGGLCEGLALSSALSYIGNPSVKSWGKKEATKEFDLKSTDLNKISSSLNMTLNEFIQSMWLYQFSKEASAQEFTNSIRLDKYEKIIEATNQFATTGKNPIAIIIKGWESTNDFPYRKYGGHVLIPYKTEISDSEVKIYVYDCNSIEISENPDEQFIIMSKNTSGKIVGWSYELWKGLIWGSDQGGSISYCDNFHVITSLLDSDINSTTNNAMLFSSTDSFSITTENQKRINYNLGEITGSTDLSVIPIMGNNIYPNSTAVSQSAFYVNPKTVLKISNTDTQDREVKTVFATEKVEVVLGTEGNSDLEINNKNKTLNLTVKPITSDSVQATIISDKGISFKLDCTTDDKAYIKMDSSHEAFIMEGINKASFEISVGKTHKNVNIKSDNQT